MEKYHGLISPEKIYFSFLENGEFKVQKCNDCTNYIFFPRLNCTHCHSDNYQWESPNRQGVIYAFTYMPVKDSLSMRNAILVNMDDGFRLLSTLITDQEIQIGDRVEAFIEKAVQGPRLVFKQVDKE